MPDQPPVSPPTPAYPTPTSPAPTSPAPAPAATDRPLWPALARGWRRTCPCCGDGPLMQGYLKVRAACPSCREDLSHQRADDGPAYLTVLLVGHVVALLMFVVHANREPDPLAVAGVLSLAAVGLSLYLLPRLKGAMVGLQWAKRMHGFGSGDE